MVDKGSNNIRDMEVAEMCVDLLHPEVLSSQILVQLLKERCVNTNHLDKLEKVDLLQLYYKTVLPLPQRNYRQNRRGRLLTSTRKVDSKKRKIEGNAINSSTTTTTTTVRSVSEPPSKTSKIVNLPISLSTDSPRLKPPPSPVNLERKTIKLNNRPSDGAEVLLPKSGTLSKPDQQSGRKIIRLINDTLQSSVKNDILKKVPLKNENCKKSQGRNSSVRKSVSDESPSEEESPPLKKKHKPITWP